MNSLHRIALTTLTILLASLFAYLFYQTTSRIGRPSGRVLTNLLLKVFPQDSEDGQSNSNSNRNNNGATASTEDSSKHDVEKTTTTTKRDSRQAAIAERTSSIIGATLGLLVFMVLFPLALMDPEDAVPAEWLSGGGGGEGQRLVAALGWVGLVAVRCWGETVGVLAVLAGVVKGLGLDGAGVVVGKDDDGDGDDDDGKRRS